MSWERKSLNLWLTIQFTSLTTIFLSFILYLCMVSIAFLAVSLSLNSMILHENKTKIVLVKLLSSTIFYFIEIFTQVCLPYPDPLDFPSGVSNISTYCTSPTIQNKKQISTRTIQAFSPNDFQMSSKDQCWKFNIISFWTDRNHTGQK